MYQNKISLSPQDILEKDFKIDTRGYRLKEVDQYLDTIIGDYEQFLNIINGLEKENTELIQENMNLKQELRNSKISLEANQQDSDVSNVDVIKRLSQLEKVVYDNIKKNDDK